ncbi:MAG: helix-turn-helix domain-containing protein [Eubacteriales bacterium]|nr:helix-turn-helix domain-containing protein [Eubacteriales bacterium]
MERRRRAGGISFAVSYIVMAFIPIAVCSLFFYPGMRRQIVQETGESAAQQTRMAMDELDDKLQQLGNLPNRIFENDHIIRSELEKPWENLEVSGELRNIIANSDMIQDAFLYIREPAYFISAYQGNISLDTLLEYGGAIGFRYENWDMGEVLESLDTVKTPVWRPEEAVTLRGKIRENTVTYLSSVPANNRFAYGAVLILLNGEKLAEQLAFSPNQGEGYLIFDAEGTVIYRSDTVSGKILEKIQQPGTSRQIQAQVRLDQNHLLNAASSRTSGWTLVKITDLGPMLTRLHRLERDTLLMIVLLSLTLGALGYYFMILNVRPLTRIRDLLKPSEYGKGRRICNACYEDIEHSIRILQADHVRTEENLLRIRPQLKKHLFAGLLVDSFAEKSEEDLLKELGEAGFEMNLPGYIIAVLRPDMGQGRLLEGELGREKWKGKGILYAMQLSGGDIAVLAASQNGTVLSFEAEKGIIGDFRILGIGIGEKVPDLRKIPASYAQACVALDYAILNSAGGEAVSYEDLPDTVFRGHSYPLELVDSLAAAVRIRKREDVEKLMGQIEYMIQMKELSLYYVRSLFYNVISIFLENRGKTQEGEAIGYEAEIFSQQLSAARMTDILRMYCRDFLDECRESCPEDEWMSQVRLYIEEHAGDCSLSLAEISAHIGMSAPWFSTLFKEKSGMNFKEYVDQIRLERAKELLAGSDEKIEDIAGKVGYTSGYSFARFFKKYTGTSPKEWREGREK